MGATITDRGAAARPTRSARAARRARTRRLVVRRLPVWILVTLLLLVVLYPQVWVVLGSFKTQTEFFANPTWSLPQAFNLDNYRAAFADGDLLLNARNTVLVTVPAVGAIVLFGTAAGYALEIMVWRGRNTMLLLFVAGLMVPGQMILVPLFTVYFRVGLSDSLWPLILTYVAMGLPLTVFLMAAYFRAVPREVFEAATIDGASPLRAFFSIGVPLMRNAIVTIGLVQFFAIWNDLLIALTFTTRSELATIQVGLLTLGDQYGGTAFGPLFAAISANIVVLAIIFLTMSKKIMAGLAAGSVKG